MEARIAGATQERSLGPSSDAHSSWLPTVAAGTTFAFSFKRTAFEIRIVTLTNSRRGIPAAHPDYVPHGILPIRETSSRSLQRRQHRRSVRLLPKCARSHDLVTVEKSKICEIGIEGKDKRFE
jgi:hypothetical protein